MIPFLIAGGSVLTTLVAPEPVETINHTLLGVKVKAKEVVVRDAWGTPMMPDGKGSYSLTAAPDPELIERSLIQPPKTDAPTYVPGKTYKLPSMPNESEKSTASEDLVPQITNPATSVEQLTIEEPAAPDEFAPTEGTSLEEQPAADAPAE